MNKFRTMHGRNLACAHCRALSRTALIVKVATNVCPDGWIKEYGGYLMAPGKGTKGEYICVDQDMKEPSRPVNFGSPQKNSFQELKEVTVRCGSLPCERYEQSKPIDCVVCTI